MNELGMEIRLVEDDDFKSILSEAEQDPKKATILQSILAYKHLRGNVQLIPVKGKGNGKTADKCFTISLIISSAAMLLFG